MTPYRGAIRYFSREHRFLSNFSPSDWIELDGATYPTVEHAFQAAKTFDVRQRERIRLAPTPTKAKALGQYVLLREDWEAIKIDIMRGLLRQKFAEKNHRKWLADTAPKELIEDNTWGDRFWGVCQGNGENWLGKLLMEIRDGVVD